MERKRFHDAPCSIARSLDVVGDWWSPLILRECLYGNHRFDDIQRWLGIGRNILTRRLAHLVEQGVLERRPYQDRPPRFEYHLTDKGYDAAALLVAMMPFGESWYFPGDDAPIHLYDRRTDRRVRPALVDAETGEPLDPRRLYAGPGPAFPSSPSVRRERFVEYFDRRTKTEAEESPG
ncbi:MAG: helix-turn-helix domain-containing protein [Acidobacteriota bacterium]